jgi:DNA polymerase alpha-associated DNA helicase A
MQRAIEQLGRLVLPHEDTSTPGDSRPRLSIPGPNSLHRVLLGISKPTNHPSASQYALNRFFDSSLNASQVAAIRFALNAPEVACIHGPPGTGKTRVLVEVIRQIVYAPNETLSDDHGDNKSNSKTPLKVLVCGASNLAVDNLLERLSLPTPLPTKHTADPSNSSADHALTTPMKHYPPIALTRLGHPARVMSSLQSRTLE